MKGMPIRKIFGIIRYISTHTNSSMQVEQINHLIMKNKLYFIPSLILLTIGFFDCKQTPTDTNQGQKEIVELGG